MKQDDTPRSPAELSAMLIDSAETRFVRIGRAARHDERDVALATLEATLATYYLLKSRAE